MALTRDFKQTISARIQSEPAYAHALLQEACRLVMQGEPHTAKLLLRDLVNASIGFEQLARNMGKSPKSLHRMLSAAGNPTLGHLSSLFAAITSFLGVELELKVKRSRSRIHPHTHI
jgi:DNA-binding phage protein